MVISSTSSWIQPAQAVVNTESGEWKFFPPRNRGTLPRALTFQDYPGCRSAETSTATAEKKPRLDIPNNNERLNKTDYEDTDLSTYSEDADRSYLYASMNSSKCDIDDPPDEYESFDNEHSEHSINKDDDPSVDCEIVVMSTPTEECIMRHKRTSIQPVISPSIPSTPSDSDSVCYSPILPNEDTSSLSLRELVDLCTRRMEEAKLSRVVPTTATDDEEDKQGNQKSITSQLDIKTENDDESKNEETSDISADTDEVNNCSISHDDIDDSQSPTRSTGISNSLKLIAIDIQLLLEELNLLDENSNSKSDYEDWICIPTQEMEALLINCYTKTVEFVLLE
ncbi:unnamed protein product [Orchesella dallaii]|uniref:Uncharacterized protein n=1 Tax=Orchesella dallaii TaxID=48710 RepID=A0ABP1QUH8_9HEXA